MNEKLYDFYYSKQQSELHHNYCHRIQGVEFTEAVPTGQAPVSNFSDLEIVKSGLTFGEVSYNKALINFIRSRSL